MSFPSRITDLAPRRAALYLRVSTGRQAAGDVSIPSQRDLTRRYCESQGWIVTDEYVEPGASATDDRRPVFQRMLEDARGEHRRFDVICVHAFSRFYRNGAEMELTIRTLRKYGVEVISITQPTGDDPSQALMRQIIGIFDEYTSRENGKNVTRAMRESARQGFWNGATPPLGYRIIEAERRGSKIKKRLAIDPVEAELVRLIFRLYADGDGTYRPLGVKETTKWLNGHGYRTRRGAAFGVGPIHTILTNRFDASGKWPYGVRNWKTGEPNDPANIVEIDIPAIVLSGGPMLDGHFAGGLAGSGTIVWYARQELAAGRIDLQTFLEWVAGSAPSVGHCNTMGTALSMNSMAEALGQIGRAHV